MCTPQGSFHPCRNLCPSHLNPPPKESSQGQGTFQPGSVCPACLGDDKKQFIISLHCKVIRNQRRFPSSLGFPLSDNSMGGFPLAPGCPTHYLTSPHCLSPFQRAQDQLNEMSKGQAGQRAPCIWAQLSPNYLSRWMELGRSFINATQPQPGPPPTVTTPPH